MEAAEVDKKSEGELSDSGAEEEDTSSGQVGVEKEEGSCNDQELKRAKQRDRKRRQRGRKKLRKEITKRELEKSEAARTSNAEQVKPPSPKRAKGDLVAVERVCKEHMQEEEIRERRREKLRIRKVMRQELAVYDETRCKASLSAQQAMEEKEEEEEEGPRRSARLAAQQAVEKEEKEEEEGEKSEGELSVTEREEMVEPAEREVGSDLVVAAGDDGCVEPNMKKQEKNRRRREREKLNNATKRELDKDSLTRSEQVSSSSDDILAELAVLNDPPPSPSLGGLREFKTAALQEAVLQLVLGGQNASPVPQNRSLAILWLSMISADLFLSRSDLFSCLTSLSPSVQFILKHPGSERFAKLGLETFLFQSEPEGEEDKGETQKPTKKDCLLSVKAMRRNQFPLPQQLQGNENEMGTTGYMSLCVEWPSELKVEETCPMFAVDCEMVNTKEGQELARVSIVDQNLRCIYDKLVKPDNPVLDYKTEFSGVTEEILRDVATSLSDVQRDLTKLLPPNCILVGHSLENDFRALKMTHPLVIDTSCIFKIGAFKPKLKILAKKVLGIEIQGGTGGHSSEQDARACMELVQRRLEYGDKVGLQRKERSVLTKVACCGRNVAVVDRSGIVKLFGGSATQFVVTSDADVVLESSKAVPLHDLTFMQLHGYEDLIRSSQGGNPPPDHMRERVLRQLDSEAGEIVSGCPEGTMVVVVCGSGDISRMRALQRQREWERLKELVAVARTGLTLAVIT